MNIIDIIGPVMIGPSSSHTAGAVRLGLLAASILGARPVEAKISLHGSFAHTYRGHGTDLALLAGLMGWLPDDARIPKAREFAKRKSLSFTFFKVNLGELTHPNTVVFELRSADGKHCEIMGSSIGGGQVKISAIDGAEVEISGRLPVLVIAHVDKPGVIALVSGTLASASVNIAAMRVFRANKGGVATMVIECDQMVPPAIVQLIGSLDPVKNVRFVNSVL